MTEDELLERTTPVYFNLPLKTRRSQVDPRELIHWAIEKLEKTVGDRELVFTTPDWIKVFYVGSSHRLADREPRLRVFLYKDSGYDPESFATKIKEAIA